MPILAANSFTRCQTSFSVTLSPQALPALLTCRKSLPVSNARGFRPFVQQDIQPIRHGDGSNVTSLSPQVHDCPMAFALLQVAECQLGELMAAEPAGQQEGEQ